MIVRKAFKYRLYPTQRQAEHLEWVLRRCQELYNAALYQRREAYRVCGASVCYYAQKRELPGIKTRAPRIPRDRLTGLAGRTVPKTLSDRWHTCPYEDCGLSLQRDHNSARTILHRAGLARAGV
jgi:transposase